MATIGLWRDSARKPEKSQKKFTAALLHGEPITPRHQPPKAIGERSTSLVGATAGRCDTAARATPVLPATTSQGLKERGQQKIA